MKKLFFLIFFLSLPVELTQFDVTGYSTYNVVKWVTATENNSYYYDLEMSIDGENWESINKQNAVGNKSI